MEEYKKERPKFPKKAIVTFGMPYGNKEIHFGHLSMMLSADFFARFLRNRIGKENVILQSGTDCYGSTMQLQIDKLKAEGVIYDSILDLVQDMHKKVQKVFVQAEISPDFYGASAFGDAKDEHEQVSEEFFMALYNTGYLKKMDTEQFFDQKAGSFLNGRQVVGKCPFEGCKSEKAYADECEMGHQYLPKQLINPISKVSGDVPILKSIANWYFDITKYNDLILQINKNNEQDRRNRKYVTKEIGEFLKAPEIYIKKEYLEKVEQIKSALPKFAFDDSSLNKPSFTIVFDTLEMREKACEILNANDIKFRNGKTLVPFRITGNCDWGVPAPEMDGLKGLTFYVWPESLWAPISFTKTYLKTAPRDSDRDWKDWWCKKDNEIYQFMAEDNIYFYGPPEQAMFLATQGAKPTLEAKDGNLIIPHIVSSKHTLYLGSKASSSGKYRAPLARELFDYYTSDQIRMHFLGLGLGETNVNMSFKPLNPDADPNELDATLKEGNVLINVYNRVIRRLSIFVDKYLGGVIPLNPATNDIKAICEKEILNHEDRVYCYKFHVASNALDVFIRNINKYFDVNTKRPDDMTMVQKEQIVANTIHMIRVANTLLNPFIPSGSLRVADYFAMNDKWTDWNYVFDDLDTFIAPNTRIYALEDETPFFKKHPSQD